MSDDFESSTFIVLAIPQGLILLYLVCLFVRKTVKGMGRGMKQWGGKTHKKHSRWGGEHGFVVCKTKVLVPGLQSELC